MAIVRRHTRTCKLQQFKMVETVSRPVVASEQSGDGRAPGRRRRGGGRGRVFGQRIGASEGPEAEPVAADVRLRLGGGRPGPRLARPNRR